MESVTMWTLRQNLHEVLNRVGYGGKAVLITTSGRGLVKLVPLTDTERARAVLTRNGRGPVKLLRVETVVQPAAPESEVVS